MLKRSRYLVLQSYLKNAFIATKKRKHKGNNLIKNNTAIEMFKKSILPCSEAGPTRGGFRGPGRVQVAALSFGPNLSEEPKLSEDLSFFFFCCTPMESNLSERLFFAPHLILGKK